MHGAREGLFNGVVLADSGYAVRAAQRPKALEKISFHRELADLGVEVLDGDGLVRVHMVCVHDTA